MFTIIYRLRRLMTRIPGYPTGESPQQPAPYPLWPVDAPSDSLGGIVMDFSQSINCCLSPPEVLRIIHPVRPDRLTLTDPYRGIWEGYWANWNDIDLRRLIKQERIQLRGEVRAQAGEPASLVVLFQVIGA